MNKQNNISNFITLLLGSNFEKVDDNCNCYSTNADLYIHEISFENYQLLSKHSIYNDQSIYQKGDKKYFVVINHFNKNRKSQLQGFDLWLSVYDNKFDIGRKGFIHNYSIRLNCDVHLDVTNLFFNHFNQLVYKYK